MADHPLKKLQGWDLDVFLAKNERFHRALDLFCFATLIFNAWWANLLIWSALSTFVENLSKFLQVRPFVSKKCTKWSWHEA